MKKRIILNVVVLIFCSLLIAFTVYVVDVLALPPAFRVSPRDALFLEGIGSVLVGFLLLLGRGGLSYGSAKAAILAAAASAVTGAETVGPSELFRKDSWKARGFVRLGFILLIAGVFMLAGYFLAV